MAKKTKKSGIRCIAHRCYLRSGSSKASVQGIRVDVMGSQKTTLKDMAESIGHANSATPSDVLAVWDAMEREIVRALENGRRVARGNLGTLRLEGGTKQRKSTAQSITSKDVEAKGVTFQPSKQLDRVLADLTFEGDGIVAHPLSGTRTEEALTEHFTTHQYISARTYATLTHCSESTARRRIAALVADGRLVPSGISKGLYEWKIEN